MSRLSAPSGAALFVDLRQPFSNFDFIEEKFSVRSFPVSRLFSQARSRNCSTLVIEPVPAAAAVADEVAEIKALFPDYQLAAVLRLSFWRNEFSNGHGLAESDPGQCVGYAILKHDVCPSRQKDKWHVFESVIAKNDHPHNYIPCAKPVKFRVGHRVLAVRGMLAGQQNGLNKACAQVSLRSVCTNYLQDHDLPYSRINELAFAPGTVVAPHTGLGTDQVGKVLKGLNVNFASISYDPTAPNPDRVPYQRAVYSGIESGTGSLLIFTFKGPKVDPDAPMHMIACFGHTFNEDTWAPNADFDYFDVGGKLRYIPSDSWMSSIMIHDDNFGSNLCIPKAYLERELVRQAVIIMPAGYRYLGLFAEVVAYYYFYSVATHIQNLQTVQNPWFKRLVEASTNNKLILRVVPILRDEYLLHLASIEDWKSKREQGEILDLLTKALSSRLWMVEFSIPDLFSTNKRKIGEMLFDASLELGEKVDARMFVLARFPGSYVFLDKVDAQQEPQFLVVPSKLESHTPLYSSAPMPAAPPKRLENFEDRMLAFVMKLWNRVRPH